MLRSFEYSICRQNPLGVLQFEPHGQIPERIDCVRRPVIHRAWTRLLTSRSWWMLRIVGVRHGRTWEFREQYARVRASWGLMAMLRIAKVWQDFPQ